MIVNAEIRAWCGDKAAQGRTRLAADDFANHWNAGLEQRTFAEATAGLESPTAGEVARAIQKLFAEAHWLDALVSRLASALRIDPYFEPPFRNLNTEIHSGLVVFEDENMSVAAGVTSLAALAERKVRKAQRSSITFSGQVEVFKFVKSGDALLNFWEIDPIEQDFTSANANPCRLAGSRRMQDGEIIVVDGRRRCFIIEHASTNLVVLQATVKPDRAPVSVEYDSATRNYVGSTAADDSASRIQMLSSLLRKLDCVAAFDAMAEFLDHPNFFVRWHVMRELLGLDLRAALPYLEQMAADDPHPEPRRAAAHVLNTITQPPAVISKVS